MNSSRGLLPSRRQPLAPVARLLGLSVLAVALFALGLSVVVLVTS